MIYKFTICKFISAGDNIEVYGSNKQNRYWIDKNHTHFWGNYTTGDYCLCCGTENFNDYDLPN